MEAEMRILVLLFLAALAGCSAQSYDFNSSPQAAAASQVLLKESGAEQGGSK
jgi:uncharacterized lipoprotein YajG